ncbi:MAG: lysine biosynthesis protein LysW [Candidatus Fischerbacteria bacterium RBG_13_37_8]|uniref:Lysine biosynthesis protein LysW n=1 Tax=Candidatus Fischerbacteria bacterium RBG_13_37_8 TaxID=1817863 RepID=A0A1F5VU94_9BACT|nr:MAG: lysine biosynthesis protein LysW [Candidatus Fischerbacteria bacterium RBG_13_37_8]
MSNSSCPVCDNALIAAANAQVSELIICPDCGSELEIKTVNPFSVVEAPREEEDWGE